MCTYIQTTLQQANKVQFEVVGQQPHKLDR